MWLVEIAGGAPCLGFPQICLSSSGHLHSEVVPTRYLSSLATPHNRHAIHRSQCSESSFNIRPLPVADRTVHEWNAQTNMGSL